jgi:hypothetical protein
MNSLLNPRNEFDTDVQLFIITIVDIFSQNLKKTSSYWGFAASAGLSTVGPIFCSTAGGCFTFSWHGCMPLFFGEGSSYASFNP